MRAITIAAVILFASSAFAQPSNPCDPRYHWLTPSNCTSAFKQIADSVANFRGEIAEQSAKLAEARQRFWATYPNKPGFAEARDDFAYRLYWKDWYYVYASLAIPSIDGRQVSPLVRGGGNAVSSRDALDFLGGKLDGGIRKTAMPEFEDWVDNVRNKIGDHTAANDPFGFVERFLNAMAAKLYRPPNRQYSSVRQFHPHQNLTVVAAFFLCLEFHTRPIVAQKPDLL
jgi:hypothetical protein